MNHGSSYMYTSTQAVFITQQSPNNLFWPSDLDVA